MSLLSLLKSEAIHHQLLPADAILDAATVFYLVRDMPYQRAGDRNPKTIIREWRGTCSGKHYLLQALFAELGYPARIMACTTITYPDPATTHPELMTILEPVGGRFVDVHNYLVLDLPDGEMTVDATWPLETRPLGMTVNESFQLGQSQDIAFVPIESWEVPENRDAQEFKHELLQEHFTAEELVARDEFIHALSTMLAFSAANGD